MRRPLCASIPSLVLLAAVVGTATAQEVVHFEPTTSYRTFAVREPVLTIRPNTELHTRTWHDAYYEPGGGPFPGEVGPFYVEGAEPGDTLVVEILEVTPNHDLAASQLNPFFGSLASDAKTRMINDPIEPRRYEWRLDREAMTGTVDLPDSAVGQMTIDLQPMLGRLAVAPANGEEFGALWPGNFGGNMDAREVSAGTTVYLPVFNEGTYLYFGDGHARQGEGEVNGTALETSMDVVLRIDLIKQQWIQWPRLEDDEHIMVAGSARPLIDAFRIAHVELIDWLATDYGFARHDAYMLLGQLAESSVANVVDPNYTVVAKFPKRFLPERVGQTR